MTPAYRSAFRYRRKPSKSTRSPSQPPSRWTCMSASPGRMLSPSPSIRSVPAGIVTSSSRPTATIRSPSIRSVPPSIGGPPRPSMIVAPTMASPVRASCGRSSSDVVPETSSGTTSEGSTSCHRFLMTHFRGPVGPCHPIDFGGPTIAPATFPGTRRSCAMSLGRILRGDNAEYHTAPCFIDSHRRRDSGDRVR